MLTTKVSTKGQVILPKSIRDSKKWPAGQELEVLEQPGGVMLRPVRQAKRYTIDDLIGCLKYDGPPKTIAEINAGIAKGAAARHRRAGR